MYCAKCGAQIPDEATVCTDCGAKVNVNVPGKTLSLLSMIFSLVALGTQVTGISSNLSLPAAIAAVICGFIAKSQAGKLNSNAQTGIICGFITIGIHAAQSILALVILVVYLLFYVIVFMGIMGISMGAGMYI